MTSSFTAPDLLEKPADNDEPWGDGYRSAMDTIQDRLSALIRSPKIYGAKFDGVTDDVSAINQALAAGGVVVIPPGVTAAIGSSIVPANDSVLHCGPGSTIKWIGTTGSMLAGGATNPLERFHLSGRPKFDPNSLADVILDLHSPQSCLLEPFEVATGHSATIVLRMQSDAANNSSYGNKNSAQNLVRGFRARGTVGTLLDLSGPSAAAVCTLNTFQHIRGDSVVAKAFRIVQWCDSNTYLFMRARMNASSSIGVVLNDSATPAANVGVYNHNFFHLAIDTFSGGGLTGRQAVVLNWTKENHISGLINDPAAEGGQVVDNNSQSHHILVTDPGGTNDMFLQTKGVRLGFFGATPATKQTVTGSRATDTWRQSVMAALAAYGLVTDSSSA